MDKTRVVRPARRAGARLTRLLLVALVCGGLAAGCGYRFQGKAQLPGGRSPSSSTSSKTGPTSSAWRRP